MYLEIYPDVIFLLNLFFDIIILYLLKKINRKSSTYLKLFMAGAAGGICAVIAGIFPGMPVIFKIIILHLFGAFLMIRIAFGRLKGYDWVKQFLVLHVITYFIGGLINSLYYHTQIWVQFTQISSYIVLSKLSGVYVLSVFIGIILLFLIIRSINSRLKENEPEIYEVELLMDGRMIREKGLMDSGNCLYDPVNRKPVMVVDNSMMEQILSPELCREIDRTKNLLNGESGGAEYIPQDTSLNLRWIPYRSVGGNGMLLGVCLDQVLIYTGKETICNTKVITAFSENPVSSKRGFRIILHKELL